MIPTVGHSGKDKTQEMTKRLVIARGWRVGLGEGE